MTIVHGRRHHLERQRLMIGRSQYPVHPHVVVAMDDPGLVADLKPSDTLTVLSIPGAESGLPLAAARNAGAAAALAAGSDLIVFLDVDCLPAVNLVGCYVRAAADPAWATSLLCGPVAYLPEPGPDGYDLTSLAHWPAHPSRPAPADGECEVGQDPRLF